MRRKDKRDEARGIVHEPSDEQPKPSSGLNLKPSSALNLKSSGGSEFAPPPASSLSAAPKKPSSAKPSGGTGKGRASSAKRAKLALAFKAGAGAKDKAEK